VIATLTAETMMCSSLKEFSVPIITLLLKDEYTTTMQRESS